MEYLAELQTNLELTSEKGSPRLKNRELITEAEALKVHLNDYSEKLVRMEDEKKALEATSACIAQRLEDLLKQIATMEKEHGRKYAEYQSAISQAGRQLLEAEERFNTKISAKEDECKALNLDKRNLEATVLQLKNQIEERSAELEATNERRKLEKDVLLSQIVAAKKETTEITRSNQIAMEAFNAEKENLLIRLAEVQRNSMANRKASVSRTNRELKTEGESLKAQLIEYSETLVSKEDEKQVLEAASVSKAELFEALLKQNATMERKISSLQQQVDENAKQHSHVIQPYKLEEIYLKQNNEMLQREVLNARCLLEIRDKSIYERIIENDKLSNQVEELSKTIVQLQEANVNVRKEKDDLKNELESLQPVMRYKVMEEKHSELFKKKEQSPKRINSMGGEINSLTKSVKKYKVIEEKHSELFKENKEQRKTVNPLRGEINSVTESVKKYKVIKEKQSELFKGKEEQAQTINSMRGGINSLTDEKSSLSRDLKEATKEHENFPAKCMQSKHRTIAQGKRKATELVDTNQTKTTIVNGKKKPTDVNEKPKPTDVNEKCGMQENRNPNVWHQSKAQNKPPFKL